MDFFLCIFAIERRCLNAFVSPESPLLEELHRPLMSFGFRQRGECSQIAPLPALGVLFARVQPVPSRLQFADHAVVEGCLEGWSRWLGFFRWRVSLFGNASFQMP